MQMAEKDKEFTQKYDTLQQNLSQIITNYINIAEESSKLKFDIPKLLALLTNTTLPPSHDQPMKKVKSKTNLML